MRIVPVTADEFPQIIDLFSRYGFALTEKTWFDWKNLGNPAGPAMTYKLLDDEGMDGTVAGLPQTITYGDRDLMALQAVDGIMGHRLRGKGLFNDVMAFLAALEIPGNDKPLFRVGYPSLTESMKAFEHAGWSRLARFRVFKAILDARALAALPGGALLSVVLDPIVRMYRTWLGRDHGGIEVRRIERFDEDLNRFRPQERIVGDRSAEFMNWRVIDNPRDTMHPFGLYEDGELVGYVVCKELADLWEVLEFRTSRPGPRPMAAFLKHVCTHRLTGVLDFWLMEGSEQLDKLPRGLVDKGTTGALYIHGHREIDLPEDCRHWACGFLDSDW